MEKHQPALTLDLLDCKPGALDSYIVTVQVLAQNLLPAQFPAELCFYWRGKILSTLNLEDMTPKELKLDLPISDTDEDVLFASLNPTEGVSVQSFAVAVPPGEPQEDFPNRLAMNQIVIGAGERVVAHARPQPYDVPSSIFVDRGGVLIIEAGSVLKFVEGAGIYSSGVVRAVGNDLGEKAVRFEPKYEGSPWSGIMLNSPGCTRSSFQFCHFVGGGGIPVARDRGLLRYDPNKSDQTRGGALLVANAIPGQNRAIHLNQVVFEGNHSQRGGALAVHNAAVSLSNATIKKNTADYSGGAVHLEHGVIYGGEKVAFDSNEAGQAGGALAGLYGSKYLDKEPSFTGNRAPRGKDVFVVRSTGHEGWAVDSFEVKL